MAIDVEELEQGLRQGLHRELNKLEGNWLDQKFDGDLVGELEIRCSLLTVSGDSPRSLQETKHRMPPKMNLIIFRN